MNPATTVTVFTIGHSTRSLDALIELLKANRITRVVDIRTIPRSQYNHQFNRETLPQVLQAAGIGYDHMSGLGGLRHPRVDSINTGWRNASFQGFADYMPTPEFAENLRLLLELARREVITLMCAEAVPWRCHRSLIADALLVRGVKVEHIIGADSTRPHVLTPWAKVEGNRITYPAPTDIQPRLV